MACCWFFRNDGFILAGCIILFYLCFAVIIVLVCLISESFLYGLDISFVVFLSGKFI